MFVGAPAIDADAVYASAGHTLYRLDRATGAIEWKVDTDTNPFAQINASPVVVDDLVLQGTASFENIAKEAHYTFRGSIAAYDTATGRLRWKFYTTPNNAKSGAGIGIWSTPAVDTKRGLLFVGTGQSLSPPTGHARRLDPRDRLPDRQAQVVAAVHLPRRVQRRSPARARTPTSARRRTSGRRTAAISSVRATRAAPSTRSTVTPGEVVWNTPPDAGERVRRRDRFRRVRRREAHRDVERRRPGIQLPDRRHEGVRPRPRDRHDRVDREAVAPARSSRPSSAVRGVAFVGTDKGTMVALDTRTGATLWSFARARQDRVRAVDRRRSRAVGLRVHPLRPVGPGRRHQLHPRDLNGRDVREPMRGRSRRSRACSRAVAALSRRSHRGRVTVVSRLAPTSAPTPASRTDRRAGATARRRFRPGSPIARSRPTA